MKNITEYIYEAKKITMADLDAAPDNLIKLWKELDMDANEIKQLIRDENWNEISKKIADTINDRNADLEEYIEKTK